MWPRQSVLNKVLTGIHLDGSGSALVVWGMPGILLPQTSVTFDAICTNMRKIFFGAFLWLPFVGLAQPAGYYNAAAGLNGQALRVALMGIIRPHTALTYTPGLWNAYYTTDVRPDGKLWDIYSDVPGGTPAYEYTLGTGQCSGSSPSAEGGCYNREHTWPQSKFGSTAPMQTDLFIVYPTDYYVNSHRGDLPYGIVGTAATTFTNGSKIGNNTYSGAPAGNCYEPLDSFKGDLARTYFYVSTCYRNDSATFVSWEMASQVNLAPWTVQMLLEWHHNDPVSQKEKDRNEAAYALQGNRNPFIDHPEFADCIWGTGDCNLSAATAIASETRLSVYPDPAHDEVTLAWGTKTDGTLTVYNSMGQVVYSATLAAQSDRKVVLTVANLPGGMYFARLAGNGSAELRRFVVE